MANRRATNVADPSPGLKTNIFRDKSLAGPPNCANKQMSSDNANCLRPSSRNSLLNFANSYIDSDFVFYRTDNG